VLSTASTVTSEMDDYEPQPSTSRECADDEASVHLEKDDHNSRHSSRVRRQKHYFDYEYSLDDKDQVEDEPKPVQKSVHPVKSKSGKQKSVHDVKHKYNVKLYDVKPSKRKSDLDVQVKQTDPTKNKRRCVNGKMLELSWDKVFYLRHLICELIAVVFPQINYPPRFNPDTHSVEALVEQIISAITDKDIVFGLPQPEGGASPFDVKVVLCKTPHDCLAHLRRRIVYLLEVLLPDLEITKDFDRNSRRVEKLVTEVIARNDEEAS
jgi:hypothetical protein